MRGTVAVEVLRSLTGGVREELGRLLAAAEAVDGYDALSDDARLSLSDEARPSPSQRSDAGPPAITVVARAGDRSLAGLATLRDSQGSWTVETVVHPSRRDGAVLTALLDGATAEISDRRGRELTVWLRGTDGTGEAERRGLRPLRELLQLRVPLPLVVAQEDPALPVRAFRPGEDEEAWLAVNNRAFAGHPEQAGWRLADLERREREPWFDPAGFLLYEESGSLAGFCWTKVHPASSPALSALGEIYVIGVDPGFQGRGLGRTLTVAGLDHLADGGLQTGMLYVESTNKAALGLYQSLGFATHHEEHAYRGAL